MLSDASHFSSFSCGTKKLRIRITCIHCTCFSDVIKDTVCKIKICNMCPRLCCRVSLTVMMLHSLTS